MKATAKLRLTLPLLLAMGTNLGFANLVTGDPATDGGWTSDGISTSSVVQQTTKTGSYSANVYSTAFALGAGSSLLGASGWNVGDTIVGVGGTFNTSSDLTYDGNPTSNPATGPLGSTSTRIVIKYGTSAASWTIGNNENGSLTLGGIGAVLLGTSPYVFSPANSGTLISPTDTPTQLTTTGNGQPTIALLANAGQVITSWNGSAMTGFESFLDLTLLDKTDSNPGTDNIGLGDEFILDLQRGSNDFQDSLGVLPDSLTAAAVPEPTTLVAGSLLVFLLGASTVRSLRKKIAA